MFTTCFHRNQNEKWIQNVHKFKWTLQKYLPSNSSGGLYHNVTTLFVYLLGWPFLLMLIALARPKSASFKIPCLVIRTLAAFISRWIILLLEKKQNILLFKENNNTFCYLRKKIYINVFFVLEIMWSGWTVTHLVFGRLIIN